uniref:Uncharacterized protein n=1 Tax=Arundo donax TaxID=35708 RepID=A0A0A8XWG4_ARUDO
MLGCRQQFQKGLCTQLSQCTSLKI